MSVPAQSDENHDFTSLLRLQMNISSYFLSCRWARRQKLRLPQRGAERPNLLLSVCFAYKAAWRRKNRDVTCILRVCAGRDWEAAEEAGSQGDFPGRRSLLHQQETEGRMAEPLEDGGGEETGVCR